MATFNIRQLIREVPAATWQEYFKHRGFTASVDFDWGATEQQFNKEFFSLINGLDPNDRSRIYSELRLVQNLAHSRGIAAIQNACDAEDKIAAQFQQLISDTERALWTLINRYHDFCAAQTLLMFDDYVGKRSWKQHALKGAPIPVIDPKILEQLGSALSQDLSSKKGPRKACQVELVERFLDRALQINIYLEDLPQAMVEFGSSGLQRRISRPAMDMAILYFPNTGVIQTVAIGGITVHQKLIRAFSLIILGKLVPLEVVKGPLYRLDVFKHGVVLPAGAAVTLSSLGLQNVSLRRVRVKAYGRKPADMHLNYIKGMDTDAWVADYFENANPMARDQITEVTLAFQFTTGNINKPTRLVIINLNSNGTSNISDQDDQDVVVIEVLLGVLGVTQIPACTSSVA